MVTLSGFILSGGLGLVARRLQLSIIGRVPTGGYKQITGYAASGAIFMGSYYFFNGVVDNNRQLLNRRLDVLREQRAKQELFNEFTQAEDHRITADKRQGRFFSLFDKYGAKYK
ncbi:hypothetical protein PSN45_000360 [Yamadazyma tenuis]|uniref:Uncharacterized protein n=1 Tax=Candida tenuis (strain ATCC 10573 / BCRC 21748 / CBS 615 / JCM 9827 / NBRC 10315 / NRRL Y-1498 / VKM Y-70) TaxID=590646 RepID=G3B7W9_CANTC|nr:uncharacterized protein CANTEDRAFT_107669 [Yamadazyma tenuis ATCC 10573]EGV61676.1 hypothetical protein CANTEDRAFT_107669 [Yamadazyma tenuis ATCC 10573]WEJ92902.1 hypothetical protein PSN45_000360 [Yamadazyma tenuis]